MQDSSSALPSAAAYPAHLMVAAGQFPEQEPLRCPRCDSTNTKFCYYNNYNLAQPRHFCKACRRYWTKGGALRNIPVGGATRKSTKRPSSSKRPSASTRTHEPKPDPCPTLPVGSGAGSFTSLLGLASDGQFDTFLDGLGQNPGLGNGPGLELGGPGSSSDGGDQSSCWGSGNTNGWPDLAIYTTPGSKFQ